MVAGDDVTCSSLRFFMTEGVRGVFFRVEDASPKVRFWGRVAAAIVENEEFDNHFLNDMS